MTAGLLLRILSSGMECCRCSRVRWREGGKEGAVFSQSERIFRSVRLCSERLPAEEEAVRGRRAAAAAAAAAGPPLGL